MVANPKEEAGKDGRGRGLLTGLAVAVTLATFLAVTLRLTQVASGVPTAFGQAAALGFLHTAALLVAAAWLAAVALGLALRLAWARLAYVLTHLVLAAGAIGWIMPSPMLWVQAVAFFAAMLLVAAPSEQPMGSRRGAVP